MSGASALSGAGRRPDAAAGSAAAGGVADELGDFFGLLFVEDAGRHPPRRFAVDAVFDRVEDAFFEPL